MMSMDRRKFLEAAAVGGGAALPKRRGRMTGRGANRRRDRADCRERGWLA